MVILIIILPIMEIILAIKEYTLTIRPITIDRCFGGSKMELDQEGYLSKQRYRIKLSDEFKALVGEARAQMEDGLFNILADRGRYFPSLVDHVSIINLDSANGDDIGCLISYFAYRDKTLEEITDNLRWERV